MTDTRKVTGSPRPQHNLSMQRTATVVAFFCAATYVLRVSLFMNLLTTTAADVFVAAAFTGLVVAFLCVLSGGWGRINFWGVAMLVAVGISLYGCERFHYAMPRWVGWTALVLALGPINSTSAGRYFRRLLLRDTVALFAAVVTASALWWLVGLPNLGRGDFTGVMWHSMVLGAMSGFTGSLAIARALSDKRPRWYALFAISCVVTLLSASRAALVALALATLITCVLRISRSVLVSWIVVLVGVAACLAPQSAGELLLAAIPEQFTAGIARKSWEHTREAHWEARWEEFASSPIVGVGFSSAWEDTIGVDPDTGAVETGSSYLALLSMTGLAGASAFALLILALAKKTYCQWDRLSESTQIEVCSLAGFWLVHLGAEGYIYAVGSLMGLGFWLWLGCLNDMLLESQRWPAGSPAPRPRWLATASARGTPGFSPLAPPIGSNAR